MSLANQPVARAGRFPPRRELFPVLAVVTTPLHAWALFAFFREVPAYLLRLPVSEILATLAYVLVYVLVESLLVFGIVLLLAAILPRRFLLDRFIPQASILVLIPALWMIPLHYQARIVSALQLQATGYAIFLAIWLSTFIIALVDLSLLFRRHPKVEDGIRAFAERLTVLAAVFLAADLLGLALILFRNLAD